MTAAAGDRMGADDQPTQLLAPVRDDVDERELEAVREAVRDLGREWRGQRRAPGWLHRWWTHRWSTWGEVFSVAATPSHTAGPPWLW